MKYFAYYLIVINIISFLSMGLDKLKAIKKHYRLSENFLIGLCVIGGSLGGLSGIYVFNHKTKHKKFTIGIPVIIAIQLIVLLIIL